jgi:N-acyl-D-aspartate/D-glutamate deacylase
MKRILSNSLWNTFLMLLCFTLLTKTVHAQLIKNIVIVDGTGAKAYKGAVRIKGDKIQEVGNLQAMPGEMVVDGKGNVLAPGFIDSHSHHFSSLLAQPEGIPNASQGVTSIIIGQDGESYLMDTLESMIHNKPLAINVATYTGHSTLRELSMGETDVYRKASAAEIEKMKSLLAVDLQKGSLGLSSGLEYEQAFFSDKQEVIDLAKVAAENHTRYMSHIRSEDITIDDAMEEIIEIGRVTKMPVQVSHIKIGIKDKWNKANDFLLKLQKARAEGVDITADVYPYNFWNSTLRVLFPKRDYTNIKSAQFAVDQVLDVNESVLVQYAPNPTYKGKTISVIAKERNETPAVTLMQLIQIASDFKSSHPDFKGTVEAIAAKGMNDADVANFIKWPYSNICSDGNTGGHPRGYGSFPRILGKYVRDEKVIDLETAIFKMTGLTAAHLGIKDRGLIAPGYFADLVLLDPETVKDNATIQNSKALSTGITSVWVNGQLIYQNQKATGNYPGILIKHSL